MQSTSKQIEGLARQLVEKAAANGSMIVTAESCTGGMVAAALTDIAGSSAALDRGLVTYSNDAKMELLGVSADTLAKYGAVSAETAKEMVAGALRNASAALLGVAITGIAGPGGGSAEKPVGLVYFAVQRRDQAPVAAKEVFVGDRAEIRNQAVIFALQMLLKNIVSRD